ncbi:hypothetical protein [Lewinella sp. W8]|uniref:hypothetical protein n=1 Tax=Lewinella sp. W8 TaxID=2528208 RepID=UPI00106722AB|nr:hypothetical protein [Lewinella sp. W8]MTB50533.1 hypothetical protein [Lewinella sp. W8]
MENIIGIWNSSWPGHGTESPVEGWGESDMGRYSNSKQVIEYLKSGYRIIAKRSFLSSPLTGELIGVPEIICDDRFIWSTEYVYYAELGFIEIDELLSAHAEQNGFLMRKASKIDWENINELLKKASFPPMKRIG